MNTLHLLCLVGAAIATTSAQYCSKGGAFPEDCQTRVQNKALLLEGGETSPSASDWHPYGGGAGSSSNSGSSSSSSNSATTSGYSAEVTDAGSSEATTLSSWLSSEASGEYTYTEGQCVCTCYASGSGSSEVSGSGSGSGSASWEESGSGSASWEESGSGSASWEQSGSGESAELLGSGSGSGDISGSGSGYYNFTYSDYCLLLQYFYNVSIEITVEEEREEWLLFIETLQLDVIFDNSLTVEEKLVAIYFKLEAYLEVHVDIKELVLYTYISEWNGYVFDLQSVAVFVQVDVTSSIIQLDESGSCTLFEALVNATVDYNSQLYANVESLISEIQVILEGSYSYNYELVLIYEKVSAFLSANADYKEYLLEIDISGYGSFASFIEVITNYWRIYNYSVAVGGDVSSCALIEVLTQAAENTTLSKSERGQINELVELITANFTSNTDIELRVEYFVYELYQWLIIQNWAVEIIFSLEIDGYGSIYELLLAYDLEIDFGVSFDQSTTSEVDVTTVSSDVTEDFTDDYTEAYTDEVEVTTEAEVDTTTATPTGDCSTALALITVSSNETDLSWSIDQAQLSWNSTEIGRFNTYEKRIWVIENNSTGTEVQRFGSVVDVFQKWTTNSFYLNLVLSIDIYASHSTSSEYLWGSVQQFCDCKATVTA